MFSVYGIETDNLCLRGNIQETKIAALENVLDKDFVRRFLIEQKHTYEEPVTEIKARYPNLKGCSLRSVKRFCNHQGIRKRIPVSDEALKCRSRQERSSRLPVGKNSFLLFFPMKRVQETCFKDSLVVLQFFFFFFCFATSQK